MRTKETKKSKTTDDEMIPITHIMKKGDRYVVYNNLLKKIGAFDSLNEAQKCAMRQGNRRIIHLHDSSGRVLREIRGKKTSSITLIDRSAKPRRRLRKTRVIYARKSIH